MEDFKIYKDKDLTELVNDPIHLGKVKAGDTKQFTFYIYNSSIHPYEDLQFIVNHDEVQIISAPMTMNEKASAELILEWKPSVDVERGLQTPLKIEGFKVIG